MKITLHTKLGALTIESGVDGRPSSTYEIQRRAMTGEVLERPLYLTADEIADRLWGERPQQRS